MRRASSRAEMIGTCAFSSLHALGRALPAAPAAGPRAVGPRARGRVRGCGCLAAARRGGGLPAARGGDDHGTRAGAVRGVAREDLRLPAMDRRPHQFSYAVRRRPRAAEAAGADRRGAVVARRRDRVRQLRPGGADRRGVARASVGEPRLRGDGPAGGARARRATPWRRCGAASGWSRTRMRAPSAASTWTWCRLVRRRTAARRRASASGRVRRAPGAAPRGSPSCGRPLVYATMGTVYNQPESFGRCSTGSTAPASALVTVGRERRAGRARRAARERSRRAVRPAGAGAAACAAVVSHGGSGTVLGALAQALPLVLCRRGRTNSTTRRARAGRCGRSAAGRAHCRDDRGRAPGRARGAGVREAARADPGRDRGDAPVAEVAAAVEEHAAVARVAPCRHASVQHPRRGDRGGRGAVVAGAAVCRRRSATPDGRRGGAAAAQGVPAARALLRRSRRRRGARAPAGRRRSTTRAGGSRPPRSSPATTRWRRSSAPRSRPGRRARTGSSSSARSIRAARSSSCTSGSRASGPAPAGR